MNIDKIKETLNTLRTWLTLIYSSLVILIGGLVNRIENNKFDFILIAGFVLFFFLSIALLVISKKISKYLKQM